MFNLNNITKSIAKPTIVNGINLKIVARGNCFLMGLSGFGKTSTLRMIAGHEYVSEVSILSNKKSTQHILRRERHL
jgi:putative spermidine/putrescine transport system ATP-binding protein